MGTQIGGVGYLGTRPGTLLGESILTGKPVPPLAKSSSRLSETETIDITGRTDQRPRAREGQRPPTVPLAARITIARAFHRWRATPIRSIL